MDWVNHLNTYEYDSRLGDYCDHNGNTVPDILAYEEFSRLCLPTSGDSKSRADGLPTYEEAVKSDNP